MSIIQTIRDKAAWLVFGIIALSLLGFLLMDAFVGRSGRGLLGGDQTTLGTVNGHKIDYVEYQKKLKLVEDQYTSQGYPMNDMMRQNVQEQVWGQFIDENLLGDEAKKLGLEVTPKELDDILFGANPPQDLRQQFTNEKGEFDVNAAKSALANLRKAKDNPAKENFENVYLPMLMENRLKEKYTSLLGNTVYYPKWMLEKQNADFSQVAAISYVNTPYTSINDSSIKVSDADINDYVSKHKEEYKQEASRSVAYVLFNAAPTAADSAVLAQQLNAFKSEFLTATDIPAFLVRKGSAITFFDGYVLKSKMQMANADTLRSLADGAVYGPYLDGGNYALAKMLGKRNLPDSVKCRHILISTQQGLADSTAKVRIDSIQNAIKGGASFAELCTKYSDDPGSKEKGGEYDFSSQQFGNLAKEFAETIFYSTTGEKKVVKTNFGYHYIEVLNQKNFEPAYKIAYLSKPIIASQETENTASGLANQFAGESRNSKLFDENAKKKNYNKLIATEIKPNGNTIAGIGSNRSLVRWINDASIGDVSETFNVDDKYVVVNLTEINKEGLMSAAKARATVESIVRNQKKAEQIKNKIGKITTLEAVATATGQQILTADSVSFSSPFIPNVGQEAKVIGSALNKELKTKISAPIVGNSGVFVIKVNNVFAQANAGANIQMQQQQMQQQAKQMAGYRSIEGLKKAADIVDKRAKLF
jgi:peptidyl-prolyl cis-trans isomerase D